MANKFKKALEEIKIFCMIIVCFIIIGGFAVYPHFIMYQYVADSSTRDQIIQNMSPCGKSIIKTANKGEAESVKSRIESFHYSNIRQIDIKQSGDNYIVEIQFLGD